MLFIFSPHSIFLFIFDLPLNVGQRNSCKTNNFSNGLYSSGTYCNSASACFVASDGKNLRLYQAVVDARKLLDELSDPETSVSEHCYTLSKARHKVSRCDSTAHLCFCLETSGRSVQHSQPAIHCQTWMYHRVGCHHKPGSYFVFFPPTSSQWYKAFMKLWKLLTECNL